MCRSSSTRLTLTGSEAWHKERSLCSGLQRTRYNSEFKGKRYATCQPCIWCTHACDNTQYEVHAQAAPQRPSTSHARKTTHTTQTQNMMEQEHQDKDARGGTRNAEHADNNNNLRGETAPGQPR